jgi:Na+/melibiose symporter-like transporter
MQPIRTALGHRDLRLLLGAGLISLIGDWVLRVGLTYYIYVLTGSTLASALMLLASFVPQILLGSLAGVFVDRWDPRLTMIGANLLLAAGLLPLMLVRHAGEVWIVYAVMAWEGCVQQFFGPAEQSMLPALVGDDQLVTANGLTSQTSGIARLAGSAMGGILAAAGGITALATVDVASFLVAAALIARIAAVRGPATVAASGSPAGRLRQLRDEWADGLRVSARQRILRVVLIFLLVTSIGQGIMSTLFAPFVRSVLHGSARDYGLIVAAQAVGGIAGGLIAAWAGDKVVAWRLLGWGAVAFGTIDLVMFLYPLAWVAVWPATACMVVVGVPGALLLAGAMTLIQRGAGESHRGRVFGALGAVEGVATVAGTIAAGLLGQATGIIPVLTTQAFGYIAGGLLVLTALGRHGRARRTGAGTAVIPVLTAAGHSPQTSEMIAAHESATKRNAANRGGHTQHHARADETDAADPVAAGPALVPGQRARAGAGQGGRIPAGRPGGRRRH